MKKLILTLTIIAASYSLLFSQWTNGLNLNNSTSGTVSITNSNDGLYIGNDISKTYVGAYKNSNAARDLEIAGQNISFHSGFAYIPNMIIDINGRVGIGTTNPVSKLQVNGDLRFGTNGIYTDLHLYTDAVLSGYNQTNSITPVTIPGSGNAKAALYLRNKTVVSASTQMDLLVDGNLGIGTTNPNTKLQVTSDANTSGAPDNAQFYITGSSSSGKRLSLAYNTSSNYGEIQSQAYSGAYSLLNLNPNGGNVLIGKTSQNNASYKLDINGIVRANEIVVNTDGADFVFKSEYKLPNLSDVKQFIDQNHHLPQIPSAKEMQHNGMSVGELNTKLLQKIEELTLYLIEQQKVNESLQKQIDQLAKK